MHSSELDSITWKLMAPTRALESAFKAWSQGEATEADVSDQYVRLGNEFIAARSRLAHGGIATNDLIDVPQQLRIILEEALALDCSPAVADKFDPQIRGVMTRLFHQLKAKQLQLTSPQLQHQQQQQQPPYQPHQQPPPVDTGAQPAASRYAGAAPGGKSRVTQTQAPAMQRSTHYPRSRPSANVGGSRSHSRNQSNSQAPAAYPAGTAPPSESPEPSAASEDSANPVSRNAPPVISAPKPPADENGTEEDALSLLQRHGALERQASKRYSTRQISRMINGSTSEQFSLPTTDVHKTFSSPEFKDSNVRKEMPSSTRPPDIDESSRPPDTPEQSIRRKASMSSARGGRHGTIYKRPVLDSGANTNLSEVASTNLESISDSSVEEVTKTPTQDQRISFQQGDAKNIGRRISTHLSPSLSNRRSVSANAATMSRIPSSPGKLLDDEEFPVFLKLGNNIRKAMLAKPPSIAAIRLRFVEVCAYIHSGDETFPEITLQDPQSGINYEITEATVSDVVEGSLLTLKVKTPEELSMEAELKEIKNSIKELSSKFSQGGGSNANSMISKGPGAKTGFKPGSPFASSNLSKFPSPVLTGEGRFKLEKPTSLPRDIPADKMELIYKEVAVVKQLSNKTISKLRAEIQKLKADVKNLSTATANSYVADRRSMNSIKEKMEANSQELLSQMESLSDIIDAQRVGVGSHGVRYPQNELDKVRRQLSAWSSEFQKSEDFIENEKPIWKKTWQAELNNVIEDQEWLKSLDLLYADLKSDLEQSVKTFELVCEANALPRKPGLRQGLAIAPPIKPGEEQAVADAVFHEITALNFNHEQRAEAVQRAERLHRARLALRSEEFEDELNTFVADAKLKPNGGFEEVERRIRQREEAARKLGEQSELEARKNNQRLREERKAKRKAEAEGKVEAKQEVPGESLPTASDASDQHFVDAPDKAATPPDSATGDSK